MKIYFYFDRTPNLYQGIQIEIIWFAKIAKEPKLPKNGSLVILSNNANQTTTISK
ncbi:MAG: hypothetical protein Q8N42_01085 [bacterium]|nr:hypothetical protein [bacterium]